MIVYVNGEFFPEDKATLPFNDRSALFADAIYEVIHIYNGKLFALDEHLKRMQHGLNFFCIPFDANLLPDIFDTLVSRNHITAEGMLYVQVSRGAGDRMHGFPDHLQPLVMAYGKPLQPNRSNPGTGISAVLFEDIRWSLCNMKTTGLLVNCLAKDFATRHDATDAILHRADIVTEATASNLFIVKDGTVFTHPNGSHVLPGITRMTAIQLLQSHGRVVLEQPFTIRALIAADEVFLTGTMSEITPVITIAGHVIGPGLPGAVTQSLQDMYLSHVGAY